MEKCNSEKDFQFNSETLLPMPEMTLEQELIKAPIPFQNRVDSLHDYFTLNPGLILLPEIVKELGIDSRYAKRYAEIVGAETVGEDEHRLPIYEPFTLEVIREELAWREKTQSLKPLLSLQALTHVMTRSRSWVGRNCNALSIYPKPGMINGRMVPLYPKSAVNDLRRLELQIAPAHHHYSISELQDLTGKGHRWIEKTFQLKGVQPEWRENVTTREAGWHYRREYLEILEGVLNTLPPPAGVLLGVEEMSEKSGVSKDRLRNIITESPALAQKGLNIQSRESIVFSAEGERYVMEELALPIHERFYTYEDIAARALRSVHWVRGKAEKYKQSAVTIKGKKSFNEDVAHEIIALARLDYPGAQGWLTVQEITEMLPKNRNWVVRQLAQIAAKSETRLDTRMKPRDHYHPDVIDQLQLQFLVDEENSEYL
jgi:hypothetical protein